VRTAAAASDGLNAALNVAFKGGAITGMLVVGLGLLGVAGYYAFLTGNGASPAEATHALVDWASAVRLISILRVWRGIFTRVRMSAQIWWQVEAGIPEDDRRNLR